MITKMQGFIEKNISFPSEKIYLEGTLTLPKNVKEPSVVLLLPGSKPTDRDENAKKSLHKFKSNNIKTISFHHANNVITSYRNDKRVLNNITE